jgi:hypothetical protein
MGIFNFYSWYRKQFSKDIYKIQKSLNEFIIKGAQLMLSDDISFKQSMLIAMIGLIIKKYSNKHISKKILLKMFKLLTGK